MKKLKIGAKVLVLDEDISGFIKSVKDSSVLIETTDGFEMSFTKNEIVIDEEIPKSKFSEGITENVLEEKNIKSRKSKVLRSKKGVILPMEVDLHIEQLVKNKKPLSNYQILNIQMDTAKHKLEFAIHKRIQRIIFIHGIGEGILRAELEFLIKRYDGLTYNAANFQKYGRGAIEVYIPQSVMK